MGVACTAADSQTLTVGAAADSTVLATIGGEPMTMADLPQSAEQRLAQIEFAYRSQRFQLLEAAIETAVRERLLDQEAEARGVTREQLVLAETAGEFEITQAQVEGWYRRNRSRLGQRTLDQLYSDIEAFLLQMEQQKVLNAFLDELEDQRNVEYLVEPVRAPLNNEDLPVRGNKRAPVMIVEFSDFECPYCRVFYATLQQVLSEDGNKVGLVYRHFPLNIHPNAQKAAEASLCANEQGKFWEMHDVMFDEQRSLDLASLKEKAGRLRLNQAAFDECLDSGRFREAVELDMREGESFGVEGTPGTFVNGIRVQGGAVTYEMLAAMIDKELRRTERR
jgi:protein-disulfide isomerase